jgi:WD40 repeat protein
MEGNRRLSLRSQKLLNPERPKRPEIPASQAIKDDFSALIKHCSEYRPSFISTPFRGSSLRLVNNHKNVVFTSFDGRIANCDVDKKQLILHHQVDPNIRIESLSITKNSQFIYIGTDNGSVHKLRFDTFEPLGTFDKHSSSVIGIFLNNEESELYTAGDSRVFRWADSSNPASGKELYAHDSNVLSFDLSLDCVHLASGDTSGVFKVYSLADFQTKHTSDKLDTEILSVKISNKNTFLVVGTSSKGIKVFNFGDWSIAREFHDSHRVSSVTLNGEETVLFSSNSDGVVKLWNLEKWQDEISIQAHSGNIRSLILSEDCKKIFTIGDDKRVVISRVPDFQNNFNMQTEATFISLRQNVKTDSLYCLSNEGHLFEIRDKVQERIAKFEKNVLSWDLISNGVEIGVVFEPNDSRVLEYAIVPLSKPRTIRYSKLETESRVSAAGFAWEGEVLIVGQSFKVSVIHLNANEKLTLKNHTFRSHTGTVSSIAIDKAFLFAGDSVGIIKVYNFGMDNKEIGQMVDESHSKVEIIRPRMEERLVFSGNANGEVIIWSMERFVSINIVPMNAKIQEIYFTRDKSNFFICSGGNLTLWNMEDLSREAVLTLPDDIRAFHPTCDESNLVFAFENHVKVMENPLLTEKLSIFGNYEESEKFLKYVMRIMNHEYPKHDPEMDEWLIEPFHINALHLYAYFDMPRHLEASIAGGGNFFNSRSGYSPMIISLEKKSYDCIDAIYESLKNRSSFDKMSLYRLSSALPELNRFSYSKLQDLYSIAFDHAFAFEMPKFISSSERLPIVKKSKRYFIPHWRFAEKNAFEVDETAIEFKQSFVKINTRIGSSQSLAFMKSLVECQNPAVYTTELVQVVLNDKWSKIKWMYFLELFFYLVYLLIVCYIVQFDKDLQTWNEELIVAFVISCFLFVYEIMQMVASGLLYFMIFWNYVDLLRFLSFTGYAILIFCEESQTANKYLLISTVILSLLRGVSYFRVLPSIRWVIKLIFDVVSELWALAFVVIYTGAASFEFYKFLEKENLSQLLPLSQEHFRIQYTTVIFIVLINPLIILNLYMAIIGEKLEKSENEKVILDGQELAAMIYEAEILFFCNRKYKKPKFLHIMQEEAPAIQAQKTSGQRIKKMAENVVGVEKNSKKTGSDIRALIKFIKQETEEINEKTDYVAQRLKK